MTNENVLTLDGNSYKEEDLDAKQKYLKAKSTKLRMKLDQVSVAQNVFTNSLIASLKETMNKQEDKEVG